MGPVSIIGGSGDLGLGLALRLGHAGLPVVIGSRDPQRAEDAVARLRRDVPAAELTGARNADAAAGGEVVVLTIPFANHHETLRELRASLRPGQVVIDATVPLAAAVGGAATRTLGVWHGSAAQQAAALVPDGVGVVSALHTVAASHLQDLEHPFEQDVLICGDVRADKQAVAALLERIPGFRCVDCGRLEMSRVTEQFTALMIGLNLRYRAKTGVRIVGLPDELWA